MKRMVLAAIAVVSVSATAHADDSQGLADTLFGRFGYSQSHLITDKKCSVDIIVDQKKFGENWRMLQTMGLLNSSLDDGDWNVKPHKIMGAFLISMAAVTLKATYEDNPHTDRCTFSTFIDGSDDYGAPQRLAAYGFDFDRATFSKIHWDNFPDAGLLKIGKHLHINPEFAQKVGEEGQ